LKYDAVFVAVLGIALIDHVAVRRVQEELHFVIGEREAGNETTGIGNQVLALIEIHPVIFHPLLQRIGLGKDPDS